jgi:hypothetical protein
VGCSQGYQRRCCSSSKSGGTDMHVSWALGDKRRCADRFLGSLSAANRYGLLERADMCTDGIERATWECMERCCLVRYLVRPCLGTSPQHWLDKTEQASSLLDCGHLHHVPPISFFVSASNSSIEFVHAYMRGSSLRTC